MTHSFPTLELEERIDRAVGRKIRRLRQAAGMSRADLAASAGIPLEELIDHERGALPLPVSRMPFLCEAIGCPMGTIVRTVRRAHRRPGTGRGHRGTAAT